MRFENRFRCQTSTIDVRGTEDDYIVFEMRVCQIKANRFYTFIRFFHKINNAVVYVYNIRNTNMVIIVGLRFVVWLFSSITSEYNFC